MLLENLYARPGHLIRRLQQIAVAIFFEALAGENITPVQYATLVAVREYPDLDIKKLANLIAVDRSTLGSVIERFDAAGLVTRKVDENDNRSRVVRISPLGEELAARLGPKVSGIQTAILDHLTEAEAAEFSGYLARLVHVNNELSRAPLQRDGKSHGLSLYAMPGHLIRRLQQICDGVFVEYVNAFNITPVQYAGLVAIADHANLTNTGLAHLIALDRATIGSVVDRLVAKGWVEASVNPEDRRAKQLNITPAGRETITELAPVIERAEARVVDALEPRARARFLALLKRIVEIKNEASRAPQRSLRNPEKPAAAKAVG